MLKKDKFVTQLSILHIWVPTTMKRISYNNENNIDWKHKYFRFNLRIQWHLPIIIYIADILFKEDGCVAPKPGETRQLWGSPKRYSRIIKYFQSRTLCKRCYHVHPWIGVVWEAKPWWAPGTFPCNRTSVMTSSRSQSGTPSGHFPAVISNYDKYWWWW